MLPSGTKRRRGKQIVQEQDIGPRPARETVLLSRAATGAGLFRPYSGRNTGRAVWGRKTPMSERKGVGWAIVFVASCLVGLCGLTLGVLLLALGAIW